MTYVPPPIPAAAPPRELSPLVKTGGSMLVSILIYSFVLPYLFPVYNGLLFATAFTVMILMHELGHVIAIKYYGMRAGAPVFIPFLGAVINLKQPPPNARVEAIIGIGGPVLGTIAAVVLFIVAQGFLPNPMGYDLLIAAHIAFIINLFNLLPVPPLDGGRITAAVSPWFWMLGILGIVGLIISDLANGGMPLMLIFILVYALPRIINTLKYRYTDHPYFQIGFWWPKILGVAYLGLGLALVILVLASSR